MRKTFASIFIAATLAFASISAFAQGPGPGPQPIPNPWVVSGNTLSPNGKKVLTTASATGSAGFNLAPGVAPTSPVNGDIWTTSSALFARINGTTEQIAPIGVVSLINGVSCALGSSCTISTTPSASVTVGTTVLNGVGSTHSGIIYDNAGIVGSTATSAAALVINNSGSTIAASPGFGVWQFYQPNSSNGGLAITQAGSGGANLTFGSASGTLSSPTAVTTSSTLMQILVEGYDGSAFNIGAEIFALPTQTWTGSARGTKIVMATTPNGSTTTATAVTIDQDKSITVVGNFAANAINSTPVGGTTPSTGAFTTLTASGGINSTAIGASTPSTGAFTSLSATAINSTPIGQTTAALGSFTNLTAKYTTAGVAPLTIYSGAVATYALVSQGSAGIQIYGQSVGATPQNGASIQINSSLNGSGPNLQSSAGIDFVSSQGVVGTPTALNSGDFIGRVGGWGYDGTSFTTTTNANAYIGLETTQAWTSSAHGAKVIIGVTANGVATSSTIATFDQDATLNVVGGYKTNGTAGVSKTCGATIVATGGIITSC